MLSLNGAVAAAILKVGVSNQSVVGVKICIKMASSMGPSRVSRRGGSTLQKRKEQLKQLPRIKKIERICAQLSCQVIIIIQ